MPLDRPRHKQKVPDCKLGRSGRRRLRQPRWTDPFSLHCERFGVDGLPITVESGVRLTTDSWGTAGHPLRDPKEYWLELKKYVLHAHAPEAVRLRLDATVSLRTISERASLPEPDAKAQGRERLLPESV